MSESLPPTMEQVDRLIHTIGDLQLELAATRAVVERQYSRTRTAILLSVLATALVFLSGGLVLSNYQATRATTQVRDEARVVTCVQENVGILNTRVAISESIVALAPAGTALTFEQEQRVAAYADRVTELLPFRDCSEEGIESYYEHLPMDPAEAD